MSNAPSTQTPEAILEALKERPRHRGRVTDKGTGAKPKHAKIDHLVVIRQSSERALEGDNELTEFSKMADFTLSRPDTRDLPAADTIRSLATDLVRGNARGAELRNTLNFTAIYDPANLRQVVGYFATFDGENADGNPIRVGYILAVYSAAKTTLSVSEDDLISIDNAFSNAIAQLVQRHRIGNIHIGPFHRLVRHAKAAANLETALQANGTLIHYDSGTIDMGTETGRDTYTLNALIGEKQYVGTVASLTKGAHALAHQGKWPKGDKQLPAAGYKLRSETDPTPIPDPDQAELVRDIIEWAADEKLSLRDIADRIAEKHRWGSGVARSRAKSDITIADTRHPETAVANLLKRGLPLWLTGTYTYSIAVPMHLETAKLHTFAQEQIKTDAALNPERPRHAPRIVRYEIDFGHDATDDQGNQILPNGEWAPRELIEKALTVRFAPQTGKALTGRAASRDQRKPLSGIGEWIDGETQWALSARHASNYILKSRPANEAADGEGRRLGWRDNERDIAAVLNPAETHQALADAIISALAGDHGVDWARSSSIRIAGNAQVEADAENIPQLEAEIIAAESALADAEFDLAIARQQRLTETAADRMKVAEEHRRTIKGLQDRIAAAQNALGERRLLDAGALIDANGIAATFAALADTEREAPAELNQLLRHTFADLRAQVSDDKLTVELAARIRIETTDGPITVGPITATVRNRAKDIVGAARRETITALVFRDGMDLATATAAAGYKDVEHGRKRIHQELGETGIIPNRELRAAAIAAPIRELKQVIWEMHIAAQEGRPVQIPAGIDPAYGAQVVSTYSEPGRRWVRAWANGEHTRARTAADIAAIAGDAGVPWDEILETVAPNGTRTERRYVSDELTNGRNANFGGPHKITFDPVLERSTPWHNHADRRVWARRCPHCQERTLTHILRVPEIPGGVICTDCRKAPALPTVTFPEGYLEKHAGHRGDA